MLVIESKGMTILKFEYDKVVFQTDLDESSLIHYMVVHEIIHVYYLNKSLIH